MKTNLEVTLDPMKLSEYLGWIPIPFLTLSLNPLQGLSCDLEVQFGL